MKQKYLFLLNILTSHEFLIQNRIELFFELVGCASVYIEFFSENLGDKLITRYNAVYKGEETDNILEKNRCSMWMGGKRGTPTHMEQIQSKNIKNCFIIFF